MSFVIPARRKSLRAVRVLLPLAVLMPAAAQGPVAAGQASAYESTMTLAQARERPEHGDERQDEIDLHVRLPQAGFGLESGTPAA